MVHDWWNGGAWGGVPVCRVGHVMADLIRATAKVNVADEYANLGDDRFPYSLGFKTKTGAALTNPATVQASAFDGLPVSSPIIAYNINRVYLFLKHLTTFDPDEFVLEPEAVTAHRYCYWVRGDDTEDPLTEADLGIDVLDEDPLNAVRDANIYAVLRRALEVPRYLRLYLVERTEGALSFSDRLIASRTTSESSATGKTPAQATALENLNWLLAQMTGTSYAGLAAAGIRFTTNAFYGAPYEGGPPAVNSGSADDAITYGLTYGFRGDGRLPDQALLRSRISWMAAGGEASIPATVAGVDITMQDGLVVDFEGGVEECAVAVRDRSINFTTQQWDSVNSLHVGARGGYWPMATFSAVYDFEPEEAPEE